MPLRRWLVPCALVLSAALPWAARAAGDSGAFVMTLGRDTLALERFTRAGGGAGGALVYRPGGVRFGCTRTLAPDGAVRGLETKVRAAADPPGAPPKQTATLEWRADTVIADVKPGGVQRMATEAGSVPYLNPSMFLLELLVRRAGASTPPLA